MRAEMKVLESGWTNLYFAFRPSELEALIDMLRKLRGGEVDHFHFRSTESSDELYVGDVELSLIGGGEPDNLILDPSRPVYPVGG